MKLDSHFLISMFLVILSMTISNVYAQSQSTSDVDNYKPQIQKSDAKADVRNKSTKTSAAVATASENYSGTKNTEQKQSTVSGFYAGLKKWLIKFIEDPVATFTGFLFVATVLLWIATKNLWKDAKRSADVAFMSSMPILSPLIVPTHTNLHPLYFQDRFQSHIAFVFENFGKTPAIIREVRADIFLCELDAFPKVNFDELPYIGYEPIIPPDSRGENAMMGVAECNREFQLTEAEFKELLAEATEKYRRMAFIGKVIYDDFTGMRHTRRFCVKLRLVISDETIRLFQLVRGGHTYNQVTHKKIPK